MWALLLSNKDPLIQNTGRYGIFKEGEVGAMTSGKYRDYVLLPQFPGNIYFKKEEVSHSQFLSPYSWVLDLFTFIL